MEILPVQIETSEFSMVQENEQEPKNASLVGEEVTNIIQETSEKNTTPVKKQAPKKRQQSSKPTSDDDCTPFRKTATKKRQKSSKPTSDDDCSPVKKTATKKRQKSSKPASDEDSSPVKKTVTKKRQTSKKPASEEDNTPLKKQKSSKKAANQQANTTTRKQRLVAQVHPDPTRNREINNILKRLHNNPNITTALIVDALRSRKNIIDIESKLPAIKERIETKFQNSLEELEDNPQKVEKMAKLEDAHKKKVEKFLKIELFLKKTERVSLKPADELYLSKYPIPVKASGFMLYSKDTRPDVKKEYPEATFGTIGRHIGEKWRGLSEDEKRVWRQKADPTAV